MIYILETLLKQYEIDIASLADFVKGNSDIDREFVEFWINQQAESDDYLVRVWRERHERPDEYAFMARRLRAEFARTH